MNFLAQTLKSKTALFGYTLTVLGAMQTTLPDFQNLISPSAYGIITSGIGFAVVVLRAITNKPLSDK